MAERGRSGILVAGVGNELLGDEGLGVHVARALKRGPPVAGVEVCEAGTALFDLLGEMARYEWVIVVDAIQGGGPPGTVYRLEWDAGAEEAAEPGAVASLHEFGVAETLRAGRLMGLLPDRLTVIGAEPARITAGAALSKEAAEAAGRIVKLVASEAASRGRPV